MLLIGETRFARARRLQQPSTLNVGQTSLIASAEVQVVENLEPPRHVFPVEIRLGRQDGLDIRRVLRPVGNQFQDNHILDGQRLEAQPLVMIGSALAMAPVS